MANWSRDVSALLLRVIAGAIFLPHGYAKVFGAGGAANFAADMPALGIPAFLGYLAAYSEFVGGALLIVGLLTRVDAFLLACTMGVAAFVVQLPDALRELQPGMIVPFAAIRGMELPLSLLAIALAILILGPGRYSLDALLRVEERAGAMGRASASARQGAKESSPGRQAGGTEGI